MPPESPSMTDIFIVALHLEVAAAYKSTPHAAEICAP
jgi:hypothetical protein